MDTQTRTQNPPDKEQIRLYMARRRQERCPPPSISEIRRQLGWGLATAASPGR